MIQLLTAADGCVTNATYVNSIFVPQALHCTSLIHMLMPYTQQLLYTWVQSGGTLLTGTTRHTLSHQLLSLALHCRVDGRPSLSPAMAALLPECAAGMETPDEAMAGT